MLARIAKRTGLTPADLQLKSRSGTGKMTSSTPGKSTSPVEVTNIDAHGIWVFVRGREYFLPHQDYPWFKNAKVANVLSVELHHDVHLYWPALDVDLSIDTLENPREYPLVADA